MPSSKSTETIVLKEYVDTPAELSDEDFTFLLNEFARKISVRRALHGGHFVLNSNQYVGMICLPSGRQIECEPKIPIGNLFYMLAIAFQVQALRPETVELERLDHLLEFIANAFAELVEGRITNGLYRWYVEQEHNLPVIRGRIDFAEDIRRNHVLRHRSYCRFTEFTWDIPENQIIRQISHVLTGWPFSPTTSARFRQIDTDLTEIERTQYTETTIDHFQYHRLNQDYEKIHQLCRLFLSGASLSEQTGTHQFPAFLFDMNVVFEEFVLQVLRQKAAEGISIEYQSRVCLDRHAAIVMKPDILIRQKGMLLAAADCKYKALEENEFKNHDFYQMLAYCTATGVGKGMLFYPLHVSKIQREIEVSNSDVKIKQISVDLSQDLASMIRASEEFAVEVLELATSARCSTSFN
jgi:5-methylcytosine-specific restriction enzyme subunit McrC